MRALTENEVAAITGFTPRTLQDRRSRGQGPPFRKLGEGKRAKVIYIEAEVIGWLASQPRGGEEVVR